MIDFELECCRLRLINLDVQCNIKIVITIKNIISKLRILTIKNAKKKLFFKFIKKLLLKIIIN